MDFDIGDLFVDQKKEEAERSKELEQQRFGEKRDREERLESTAAGVDKVLMDMGKFIGKYTDQITPGFFKRYQNAKIYDLSIKEAVLSVDDQNLKIKKTIYKEFQHHKVHQQIEADERAQRLAEIKLRDEVYKPIIAAQLAKEEQAQRADYQRRREIQLQSVQARIDKEKKELADLVERELYERRSLLHSHWSQQAPRFKAAANSKRREHDDQLEADYEQGLVDTYSEWDHRKFNQARLQTEAPGYLDNHDLTYDKERFGIFGRAGRNTDPDREGDELLEEGAEDAKYEPFLDSHDVKVFHSEPNVRFEEKNEVRLEAQADVHRNQQLYDALKGDCKELSATMERMCQIREMTERDLYQIQQEECQSEGERYLIPPKRLPGALEIESIHDTKERLALTKRRIADLQYSINKTDEKKRNAEAQMLTLARDIAVGKDVNKKLDADLQLFNGPLGMLPVVLGRSLQRVQGLDVHTANPKVFLEAVTQQSRFVELKEMGKVVQKVFKERNATDQAIWITNEEHMGVKDELNKIHR